MKKLNKIKLTVLNRNEIADREQRMLKGGADYQCGCITTCLDELCICLDDGGVLPSEKAYERYSYGPKGENLNGTTAETNKENNFMP